MTSLNLFANLDAFSSDDVNYSFGELEDNDNVVELPEDSVLTATNSRTRKKNTSKAKVKSKVPEDFDCSDTDNDASVNPGLGQKTAFKKLTKLKKSLATTAVTEPAQSRTRTSANVIREAYKQNLSKRTRLTTTSQIAVNVPVPQPNVGNESLDDEDLRVYIKIKWEGTSKIERIQFSTYKKFSELIQELSAREKIDTKSFLLMFGNDVIKQDDSPHSIGYTLGKFISVRVVENPNLYIAEPSESSSCNTVEVKIQTPQWKKPMICNVQLTDQFMVLIGMCSEKLQCNPNRLRLKFDGEIMDSSFTLEYVEFEGGEILDLMISD